MNRLLIFLLFISLSATAQELELVKATQQTINSGAAPMSTTNYVVHIKKNKVFKWSIDSVVNVYTQKSSPFQVVKVTSTSVLAPSQKQMVVFSKNDKGLFYITFSSMKSRGSGRPGTPMNMMVPVADFTQGAIVYYRVGKKQKKIIIELFDELETINAP
jgi:hypothetical protein